MSDTRSRHPLVRLALDLMMSAIFVALVIVAAWIAWVFYVRGPIGLETRGFVSRSVMEEAVSPSQVEKYTLRHFHNLDAVAVAGVQYRSACLSCHGDYPHAQSEKVRAFFNAHAWFIECEVCHVDPSRDDSFAFRWLANGSNLPLSELRGNAGDYGGRISPVWLENGTAVAIGDPGKEAFIARYSRIRDELDEEQRDAAIRRIHQDMNESPASCDRCHTDDNGLLDFEALLYPSRMAMHLQSIDVAAMVTTYERFHLPSIFDLE